jgi:hypothetical protein
VERKSLKIYGTQVYQLNAAKILLDYEFEPNLALELTLHSNVAKDNNTGTLLEPYPLVPEVWETHNKSPDKWLPTVSAKDNINDIYEGYVLIANNFYIPKTYEYTDMTMTELKFWFKNRYGVTVPIFYVFFEQEDHNEFFANFLLFKIECELLTI